MHVLIADLPAGILASADRQPVHTQVYADTSLLVGGQMTADGRVAIEQALAAVGGESLASASPCSLRLAS
ncbi:hypothetical protein ACWCWD_06190 [Streptomyces sp. NPDC001493]